MTEKMSNRDPIIEFTDCVLIEGEGYYDKIKEIMKEDVANKWMLRTNIIISSESGESSMILHFYADGKIVIMEYMPSMSDVYYNTDIQSLSFWSQDHGWGVPQPDKDLVLSNLTFWKHFWDTMLVDSDLLTRKYGSRITEYYTDYTEETD